MLKTLMYRRQPLLEKIENFCIQHNLFQTGHHIIVGLSGGPDSVLLLVALLTFSQKYNLTLYAAHLDHEWRSNSADDALFCKDLCHKLKIPFFSKKISELSVIFRSKGSKEELARRYRNYFFTTLLTDLNANSVALAHHQDDQIETFFIRLIRGSSLTGLSCMKALERKRIRPLLSLEKKEILNFLQEQAIPYHTDQTNASLDYLRNRIRHQLIPVLEQIDQRSIHSIAKTITSLNQADNLVQESIQTKLNTISPNPNQLLIPKLLQETSEFLQTSILLQWLIVNQISFEPSQGLLKEILRFFHNTKSHTHQLSNTWSIRKQKNYATLTKQK